MFRHVPVTYHPHSVYAPHGADCANMAEHTDRYADITGVKSINEERHFREI